MSFLMIRPAGARSKGVKVPDPPGSGKGTANGKDVKMKKVERRYKVLAFSLFIRIITGIKKLYIHFFIELLST